MAIRSMLVGIGSAAALPCDLALDLGDQHPTSHGPMQLAVDVDDDTIVSADAGIGLMHRSAEKLFEVRDYRQVLMLGNRHDWINPITSELSLAIAVEQATGITPPERAAWARTLLAELTRVGTTMLLLGSSLPDAGALRLRAEAMDLIDALTGARVHPHVIRIGGLAVPVAPEWLHLVDRWLDAVDTHRPALVAASESRWAPLAAVAALPPEVAISLGVTGPVLRASGVDSDLRRDAPDSIYHQLQELLVGNTAPADRHPGGDIPSRYQVLLDELPGAISLVRACARRLRDLGEGPIDTRLPKVLRVPEGTSYAQVEGPLGIAGVLLDSTGDKVPSRVKLRTPAFANVQAMAAALPGVRLADLADAVRSFHIVIGDADR